MLYLNNAGTSWPKPPSVAAAVREALTRPPWEAAPRVEEDRAALARMLGVEASRLLVTPSCTSALALALGELPWEAGDRLLCSHLEHHALARWASRLEQDRGVEVARSPYAFGHPMDLEWLRRQLARQRVRAVAFTAAANTTGEVLPIRAITDLAHQHGALAIVDGAQLAGLEALDLVELGVDVFTVAGHKGPLGPQGVGLLYVAPSVTMDVPAASCDVGTRACGTMPSWCDVGSVPAAALAGLVAGFSWTQGDEGRAAWSRARDLARRFAGRVRGHRRMRLLGGLDVPRTATVALELEGGDLGTVEARCRAKGLVVRVGSHCAPWALEALGRSQGVLRVSFGPLLDDDADDRAFASLADI